jgi:hypothetical protein
MDVRRLDFTKLSEDDLIELNRRIVERLQLLRSAKSLAKLATFSVGMVVEFETEDGRTISGTVARLNQRTATVVAASGRWRVSPSLLRAAARRGIRRCDPPASLHCDRAESSARLAQIQELPEAVSRGRFSGRNIAGKLVLVERPPDGSEESRKFSREGGIIASRVVQSSRLTPGREFTAGGRRRLLTRLQERSHQRRRNALATLERIKDLVLLK